MRHRKKTFKINKHGEHRKSMIANMVCSLLKEERIMTTPKRAKFARSLAEKMITLGKDGTLAAGEFVTEERYLAQLTARAPAGWENRNIQVVLGTELVNGVPGPPRILAQHVW